MTDLQRRYWDKISDHYQDSTEIAQDDFHYGPRIPGEHRLKLLPPLSPGMRTLELGCGGAQNSIWLARRGACCTAVDLSSRQLNHATRLAQEAKVRIDLIHAPLEQFDRHVEGRFHLIHSSHAMEFVEDPANILRRAAARLLPGGMLLISTVHPLYNGDWVECLDDEGNPDGMGLLLRHYFHPPDDLRWEHGRLEVVSRAYPVSSWFEWLRQAGLTVTRLLEPAAVTQGMTAPYSSKDWTDADETLSAIPGTLILTAVKASEV